MPGYWATTNGMFVVCGHDGSLRFQIRTPCFFLSVLLAIESDTPLS